MYTLVLVLILVEIDTRHSVTQIEFEILHQSSGWYQENYGFLLFFFFFFAGQVQMILFVLYYYHCLYCRYTLADHFTKFEFIGNFSNEPIYLKNLQRLVLIKPNYLPSPAVTWDKYRWAGPLPAFNQKSLFYLKKKKITLFVHNPPIVGLFFSFLILFNL
jgi:hypothetical protein